MALPSLFRRKDKPAAPAPAPAKGDGSAETVRRRARRRLIGAVVLLGIGIIAFPLLFETAPRPIPVSLPIEIPRKDAVAPLPLPASAPAAAQAASAAMPVDTRAETPARSAASAAEPAIKAPPVEKAAEKAPDAAPVKAPAKTTDEAARARALLEGRTPAAPAANGERWVVQIGAFAEEKTVRDARARAGKLGLSTFTQVVAVEAGERTRVRVGPFDSRGEADAVAAKLKQAGLPASVLKP